MIVFREYLLETIRRAGIQDLTQHKFSLYWDTDLLNQNVTRMIKEVGLLTDDTESRHTFSLEELQGGPPPKYTPQLQFGPLGQPAAPNSMFGTQPQPTPTATTPFQQPTSSFPTFTQQPQAPTPQAPTPQPFGFAQPQQTTPQPSFGFGQQTTQQPFGQSQQPATNIFGQPTATNSVFGQNSNQNPFKIPATQPFGGTKPFGQQKSGGFNWGK